MAHGYQTTTDDILPDILDCGLDVVFCGSAVGPKSAERRSYYAGPGNKFWQILADVGLTPHRLRPSQFKDVNRHGIGLTDLVKKESALDRDLNIGSWDRNRLRENIESHEPRAVAFNGKRAASEYLGRDVDYGPQPEVIGKSVVFVLPSTSGAARKFWEPRHWYELAHYIRNTRPRDSAQIV